MPWESNSIYLAHPYDFSIFMASHAYALARQHKRVGQLLRKGRE
jgi:hypothetical protein